MGPPSKVRSSAWSSETANCRRFRSSTSARSQRGPAMHSGFRDSHTQPIRPIRRIHQQNQTQSILDDRIGTRPLPRLSRITVAQGTQKRPNGSIARIFTARPPF